jgi:S-adenosylmethionine:tRNA ribosyltransferase-isomerase
MVTADTPVPSLDGLLTGWHEPESTHLMMLESFASRDVLSAAYAAALDGGYLWHEFGDSHLILRGTTA